MGASRSTCALEPLRLAPLRCDSAIAVVVLISPAGFYGPGDAIANMKANLEHLKRHVKYPTDRKGLVAACNNMSDVDASDRTTTEFRVVTSAPLSDGDVVEFLLVS